ncbi:NifU family protein [Pseudonocardia oroxyli]|uniref:Fe-S cluster biogenesis protein NfuA, 4Fe-4S-binding domain n=1 Tax=Pseudonocardia oroxyli TaxID=366584 RepID=A0A1G7THH1_PSEOR|nr:NifU family protein [Pseudonocardia oroxyli]SDG34651.1 Fe-S cluster biogenesis protein NfuA, 4Fe-4S-binding domain [Pseudonocardia oroxyli]
MSSAVVAALDDIRPGLEADGFGLFVASVEAGHVTVCLQALPGACHDCLVPDDLLQQIVESAIRGADPTVDRVTLVKQGFDTPKAH